VPDDLEVIPGTLIIEKPAASVVVPSATSQAKPKHKIFKKRLENAV